MKLKEGYSRIPNKILEALAMYRIPGEQRQCLDLIMRKTFGWSKISDNIAISQFVKETGLSKSSAIRALGALKEKKIIKVLKDVTKKGKTYQINTRYGSWKKVTKKSTVKKGYKKVNGEVTNKSTTIDTITIIKSPNFFKFLFSEYYLPEYISRFCRHSIEYQLSDYLWQQIRNRKSDHKEPDLNKWLVHIDRMIRIDKRHPAKIKKVIEWCQQDGFWQNNVLSTESLRKQFDRFELQMGSTPIQAAQINTVLTPEEIERLRNTDE